MDKSKLFLYTFGSPRVGNKEFGDYFITNVINSFRVVNYKDIVPHLPPFGLGFFHVGVEIWMLSNGAVDNFKVCS